MRVAAALRASPMSGQHRTPDDVVAKIDRGMQLVAERALPSGRVTQPSASASDRPPPFCLGGSAAAASITVASISVPLLIVTPRASSWPATSANTASARPSAARNHVIPGVRKRLMVK